MILGRKHWTRVGRSSHRRTALNLLYFAVNAITIYSLLVCTKWHNKHEHTEKSSFSITQQKDESQITPICELFNDRQDNQANFYRALRQITLPANGVNKHIASHTALNSISAQCCVIYPKETGFRFEKLNGTLGDSVHEEPVRVSMNTRDFPTFFDQGWPKLRDEHIPFVIVTCCEDDNVPWELFSCSARLGLAALHDFLSSSYLIKWYSQNLDVVAHSGKRIGFSDCSDKIADGTLPDSNISTWEDGRLADKLEAIPIGVRFLADSEVDCSSMKTLKSLHSLSETPPDFMDRAPQLLLAIPEASLVRDRRRKMFSDLSKTGSHVKILSTKVEQVELYTIMSQYMFVAAPASHGQDTYRFWETLLVGAVPVLLHGPLDTFYSHFPCILLNDWTEVTSQAITVWQERIVNRFGRNPSTSYKKYLTSQFWVSKIKSAEYNTTRITPV